MSDLTDSQLLRYARNILLPQIDIDGQQALLNSRVAVVGAGGLGSPVLQYLAAAGVGALVIIDDDVVEQTNLQRQVIHNTNRVGRLKTSSAAQFIREINSDVEVVEKTERLTADNVEQLLAGVSLVVVGTDNFDSRYVVNDYCLMHKIPLVSGAAIGFSGQVTSFDFTRAGSPCFKCLFPNGQDDDVSCATAGVLGPTVGTIGSVMAMEAMKVLTAVGQPLYGRLLTWDALTMDWQIFRYSKSPTCSCACH